MPGRDPMIVICWPCGSMSRNEATNGSAICVRVGVAFRMMSRARPVMRSNVFFGSITPSMNRLYSSRSFSVGTGVAPRSGGFPKAGRRTLSSPNGSGNDFGTGSSAGGFFGTGSAGGATG